MRTDFTLCIGRQLGSGGREVAKRLAARFDAAYYDKEIIYYTSKESGISPDIIEKADEVASKGSAGWFSGAQTYGNYLCNDNLFKIQSDVMIRLARKGPAVFVGRCAEYILRNEPRVFSFFISADMEDRIRRVMKSRTISQEEAKAMIELTDKKRSSYYNYYTFKQWGAASSYDMCINTSKIGVDKVVETIAQLVLSI